MSSLLWRSVSVKRNGREEYEIIHYAILVVIISKVNVIRPSAQSNEQIEVLLDHNSIAFFMSNVLLNTA